ncbi:hypothetical protein F511_45482 [Dorcoceras hygrometricum]|uniref:Uncharacterized protein n=1 Tax=Dorcoceras hygrometricum TaxID=472368 RepID=A0A2Z6ZVX1_9LAMI|nr:hypothetical protein F511_45482 [Dorcoceras hygrometricum]
MSASSNFNSYQSQHIFLRHADVTISADSKPPTRATVTLTSVDFTKFRYFSFPHQALRLKFQQESYSLRNFLK